MREAKANVRDQADLENSMYVELRRLTHTEARSIMAGVDLAGV